MAAVTAGSCAGGHVLVHKLEVFLLLSCSELAVLGLGVVFGLNVSTAVDFHLQRDAVQAGSSDAASGLIVRPGALSTAMVTTTGSNQGHAAPILGDSSISPQ